MVLHSACGEDLIDREIRIGELLLDVPDPDVDVILVRSSPGVFLEQPSEVAPAETRGLRDAGQIESIPSMLIEIVLRLFDLKSSSINRPDGLNTDNVGDTTVSINEPEIHDVVMDGLGVTVAGIAPMGQHLIRNAGIGAAHRLPLNARERSTIALSARTDGSSSTLYPPMATSPM